MAACPSLFVLGFFCLSFLTNAVQYNHNLTLKENVFVVHWMNNATNSRFYFKLVATTTGWVGFALTLTEGGDDMKNYDIALGGKNTSGNTYLNDYWSTAKEQPKLDYKQNLNLTSAMESGGKTTLEFNRLAVTNDNMDVQLTKANRIFMAWAIGNEDATNSTVFSKHGTKAEGGRGHTSVAYNMYTGMAYIPAKTTTVKPPTTTGASVIPSVIILIVLQAVVFLSH